MIRKLIPYLVILVIIGVFFWQFFIKGFLPIPSDTIIGLYHPYRDLYAKDYPNGIPYKNFLITDPVRQTYPWKSLSIDLLRRKELPTWNPYSFSGTPLLANLQSAVFYPLNIIFFILPFKISWSIFILIQPLLAAIFLFVYLRNLKLDNYSSLLGAIVFSFSGFFTSWLEWGNILHTALWLPLMLLSIDKIQEHIGKSKRGWFVWSLIFVFAGTSSLFAGHLQTFFYLSIVVFIYSLLKLWNKRSFEHGVVLILLFSILLIVSSIQLIPALRFILLSARSMDQILWQKDGWFLPWQHLIQFIVPDFFGNPTTLNYWGVWNYGELTPYVGIPPLIIALFAVFFRRDRKTFFFTGILISSLIFTLPDFISKIPFILNLPFISTSQPTRLIYLIDFSLSVLSALGLNYLIRKERLREIFIPIVIFGSCFVLIFIFIQIGNQFGLSLENLAVAKRNLVFPLLIFISFVGLLLVFLKSKKEYKKYILCLIILLTIVDLFRFSWKFNTFSKSEYLFPKTITIDFISQNIGNHRIATTDARILPPNFSSIYKIQSVEGYDPLFQNRYGELIAAINRNESKINPPFGFNRIVRVENFSGNLIDLLGIKYILTLSEVDQDGLVKVFEEGQTKVYENKNVLPRAFFVREVVDSKNKQETIDLMFDSKFNPKDTAIAEGDIKLDNNYALGEAEIISYSENKIVIKTNINFNRLGFLVLTDSFYPTWHAKIEGYDSNPKIIRTDYNFRGIVVPSGKHVVTFYTNLL